MIKCDSNCTLGISLACHDRRSMKRSNRICVATVGSRTNKHKLRGIIDSGATVHCINDKSMFSTMYSDHPPVKVVVANKQTMTTNVVGEVHLPVTTIKGEL